ARATPDDESWRAPKGWPANPRFVTQRLHKQAPVLRKAGWEVTDDGGANKDGTVRWTLTPPRRPEMAGNPSPPSPPPPRAAPAAGQAGQAGQEPGPSQADEGIEGCRVCRRPLDPVLARKWHEQHVHPKCSGVAA